MFCLGNPPFWDRSCLGGESSFWGDTRNVLSAVRLTTGERQGTVALLVLLLHAAKRAGTGSTVRSAGRSHHRTISLLEGLSTGIRTV